MEKDFLQSANKQSMGYKKWLQSLPLSIGLIFLAFILTTYLNKLSTTKTELLKSKKELIKQIALNKSMLEQMEQEPDLLQAKVITIKSPNFSSSKKVSSNYKKVNFRYRVAPSGIIWDLKTNLEWFIGPDINTNYYQAKRWAQSLVVGGGVWRLPLKAELKSLYQKGVGTRNIDPVFKITGWYIWSLETDNSQIVLPFGLYHGSFVQFTRSSYDSLRVFAVRPKKR